ncbi:MAG: sensor histidine kinase [Bryobacteraceae bacterium]
MTIEHESSSHLLWVLIAGFALLVLLLLASGFVAIDSMRSIELEAGRAAAEQQATIRLIDEVQREEGNLSSVFYSLATGREQTHRQELLRRLDSLEGALHRTTSGGRDSPESALWDKVRASADAIILEARETLKYARPPSETFYRRHQDLLDSLAELANSSFNARAALQEREAEHASSRVRQSIILLGIGLAVAAMSAVFTVWSVLRMFRRLRWQAAELAQLSSRVMSDQEETARRLSREMHDHFGQTLSAIEANLVAMKHAQVLKPERIEDCLALLMDAVGNVREVSQLLRPTILDDFGLDASLRWLVEGFAERTGIKGSYTSTFQDRLNGETETQLFRIAQEALTNVVRHAAATEVQMELTAVDPGLRLMISDNGRGLPLNDIGRGLGLTGMRARTRAAGGLLKMSSAPGRGVTIIVDVPLRQVAHAT